MGIPPAGFLTDVYLKTANTAKKPFPIFPLPSHLIQEKTVSEDIFHTLSGIFLADFYCVGRYPSVIFSHGSFSCSQPPHQRPDGPLWGCSEDWPDSQDSSLLFDQLVSLQTTLSFHSLLRERGHVLLCGNTDSDFMLWQWVFFSFP